MNEITTKEFMYRKTINKNIYILSKLFDEVMNYEEYKDAIYNNKITTYKHYPLMKRMKDCLNFLICNKVELNNKTISELFYKLFSYEKEFNINLNQDYLDQIVDLIKQNDDTNLLNKYVFAFVIINYFLIFKENRLYRYNIHFYKKLFNTVNSTYEYEELKKEINKILETGFKVDENYYKNLKELTSKEIEEELKKSKKEIKDNYKIKNLCMFGSFAKNKARIDSDIDLLIVFENDLSYEEKKEYSNRFKLFLLSKFNRYGDVMEFNSNSIKEELYYVIY